MVLSVEYTLQSKIKWYSFSIWLSLHALHSLFSSFTPYHLPVSIWSGNILCLDSEYLIDEAIRHVRGYLIKEAICHVYGYLIKEAISHARGYLIKEAIQPKWQRAWNRSSSGCSLFQNSELRTCLFDHSKCVVYIDIITRTGEWRSCELFCVVIFHVSDPPLTCSCFYAVLLML